MISPDRKFPWKRPRLANDTTPPDMHPRLPDREELEKMFAAVVNNLPKRSNEYVAYAERVDLFYGTLDVWIKRVSKMPLGTPEEIAHLEEMKLVKVLYEMPYTVYVQALEAEEGIALLKADVNCQSGT